MNERLEKLKQDILAKKHHRYRQPTDLTFTADELAVDSAEAWETLRHGKYCALEQPVILPGEKLVFSRTIKINTQAIPEIYARENFSDWPVNICADWEQSLTRGLAGRRAVAVDSLRRYDGDPAAVAFLQSAIAAIDAVLELAQRYAEAARRIGRDDLALILEQVPAQAPRTFHEALQSLRFMHGCLWFTSAHVGLGRFDQYMLPYYRRDLERKVLTVAEADDLIAEFFISLNKDIDLYSGVQLGDNGQSLMLGGVTRNGDGAVNELTWAVLRVSRDVNMIDPKINLRLSRDTDPALLREAVKLTRCGLGFPQYCNDDVVIPALAAHGYKLEDARDYSVAACWEFIIPGRGMEVPNINAVSFPAAVDQAIRTKLGRGDFATLEQAVAANIRAQVNDYLENHKKIDLFAPNPFYSVLMTSCLERGKDINHGGCDYYNYGIHGSGSANAADALIAVKKLVYDEPQVKPDEIIDALWKNWDGHEELRQRIRNVEWKIGNHCAEADAILRKLFDWFADACEAINDNGRGGIVRPGTGTAMFYIWLTIPSWRGLEPTVGATADGRKVGEFFSSSLAPSPGAKVAGPISVLQSFAQIDYSRIYNGGPITLELSDTVFRNDSDLDKVAMLVAAFVRLGCQQLQMNVLNPAILEEARKHPEQYRNLIVRVWGWSGYFVELAPEYQQHIINRNRYTI